MPIATQGLDEAETYLAESSERALAPAPALAAWAEEAEAVVTSAIDAGTSPDGARWAPRKLTTADRDGRHVRPRARAQRAGRTVGTLTGEMRSSVSVTAGDLDVSVSVDARHARFFDRGARYQPARSLLPTGQGASEPLVTDLCEALADHVVEGL